MYLHIQRIKAKFLQRLFIASVEFSFVETRTVIVENWKIECCTSLDFYLIYQVFDYCVRILDFFEWTRNSFFTFYDSVKHIFLTNSCIFNFSVEGF